MIAAAIHSIGAPPPTADGKVNRGDLIPLLDGKGR
jgi:hypothetical protein